MFAAKSLTIEGEARGQFADWTLALVVMRAANDKMCRFAPSVPVATGPFLFKFVCVRERLGVRILTFAAWLDW
jgi:hypothetical protein